MKQPEGSGLEISSQVQPQAMIHPPSTGSDFWGPGLRLPFDPAKFVLGIGIEALQLKQGKPAAFLGGMGEGEDHRLVFLRRHRFGGRKGTVVAGADQPIEVAMNNGGLHGVIDAIIICGV